jgi:2-iminobutanoate/2-iminopropanoate deaminase
MSSKINSIFTDKAPNPVGPYSQAIRVENFVFISGMIALIPGTNDLDVSSFEAETTRVLDNLSAAIVAAGSSMEHVAKVTIYLKNMDDFPRLNAIYATYFKEPYPARVTVEVSRLPKDVSVEIEAIAVVV